MKFQVDMHVGHPKGDEDVEQALLRSIDETLEQEGTGWDNYEDPMLMAVLGSPATGLGGMQLPTPSMPHPNYLVYGITKAIERDPGPLKSTFFDSGAFYGWLLVTEGWTVPQPADDAPDVEKEAWRVAWRENLFHQHPDRVEQRMMLLVTRYDRVLFFTKNRGDEAGKIHTFNPDDVVTDEPRLGGSVPDGMRRLMDVTRPYLPDEEIVDIPDGPESLSSL